MLKVYSVTYYISIDGADWREVSDGGYKITDEEIKMILVLDNASFDEVRVYLSQNHLNGIWNEETLFRHKLVIDVSYSDAWDNVRYYSFNTLSYKKVYREWETVPMRWLMEHASADQFIQYLKERGITACPIKF